MSADREYCLSRRRMFLLARAGVAARLPLNAATADFWNKKAPADWTDRGNRPADRKVAVGQAGKGAIRPRRGALRRENPGSTRRPRRPGAPRRLSGRRSRPGGGYPGGERVRVRRISRRTAATGGGISTPGIGGLRIPGSAAKGRGHGDGGAPSPVRGHGSMGERPSDSRGHEVSAARSLRRTLRDQRQRDSAVARAIHALRRRRRFGRSRHGAMSRTISTVSRV